MRKKAVVIGASSGVGRALAEELAKDGYDMVISARDERSLTAVAQDLAVRYDSQVHVQTLDLASDAFLAEGYVEACLDKLGKLDGLFITAGVSIDDDHGINDSKDISLLINTNYSSLVQLINQFAEPLKESSSGVISVVSSIAAHAPRSSNLVYASAKSALETYCLGLRHYLAAHNVNVNIVALGYADTALAYGKKLLFPKAPPATIAKYILKISTKNKGLVFYPGYWRIITFILSCLPWTIYKRLSF